MAELIRTYMCDITDPHVWHDSFICVTWLIHVCDMTHSDRLSESVVSHMWMKWSHMWMSMCDMTHSDRKKQVGWTRLTRRTTRGLPRAWIPFSTLFGNPCSILFGNTTKTALVSALHDVKAILDLTIRVSLLLPPLFSLPPSPFSFLFFLRKQRRCRCYTDIKTILDFTIRVSLLLPPLFSLPPCPFFSYSFRQHYEISAGVGATLMSRRF